MSCEGMCKLIRIMLSISANTGWIERAYGILEPIRQEKRNRLSIHNEKSVLLGCSQTEGVKDVIAYGQKVKNLLKGHQQCFSSIELQQHLLGRYCCGLWTNTLLVFLVLHSVFPKRIAMCGYTSLNLPLFLLELWVVACEYLIFQLVVGD